MLVDCGKFTEKNEQAQIEFGSFDKEKTKIIYVKDNGVGFDMAYSKKLFVPFQRLHHANDFAGTGIGLSTVKRIISRHKGKIWCQSAPGKGATFYFVLPILEKAS